METHTRMELHPSQRAQDLVEDLYDFGLIVFAVVWTITETHFDEEVLARIAVLGAGARAVGRRIFRAFLSGPINRWAARHGEHKLD